jgi:hypothetical protein
MTQARDRITPSPRRGPTVSGRKLVVLVLAVGAVGFGLVIFFVWRGVNTEPAMHAPPVGAGAGETGMYNQHMGKRPSTQPTEPPPTGGD